MRSMKRFGFSAKRRSPYANASPWSSWRRLATSVRRCPSCSLVSGGVCLVEVTDQDCQVVIIAEAVRELMCLVGGRLDHLGPAPVHEAQVIPEVLGAFSPLVQRVVAGVVERLAIAPAPAGVGAPEAGSKELEPVGVQRPVLDRLVAELDLGRGSVPQRFELPV